MARNPIWKSIRMHLVEELSKGHYAPGDKLPTEAELATRFGVNRHTVRRALSEMSDSGLTYSRRGAGVFVASQPTSYPIGRRVRFHQNLTAAGQSAEKRILRMETRAPDGREAEALNVSATDQVAVYEALSLADDAPIALSRSVFPAARFPDILRFLKESGSVTEAFKRSGLDDYTRALTRLTAKLATPTQALHLRVPEGAPILRSVSVNIDSKGNAVEYGHTWFAGDRVTLTVSPES